MSLCDSFACTAVIYDGAGDGADNDVSHGSAEASANEKAKGREGRKGADPSHGAERHYIKHHILWRHIWGCRLYYGPPLQVMRHNLIIICRLLLDADHLPINPLVVVASP